MKPRRRFSNPTQQRRFAVGLIAFGGALAGLGAALRADGGSPSSYFLDVLGWFVVVAGAVLEAKTAQLFLAAFPRPARRRAIAFAVVGVIAALAGCVVASAVVDRDSPALLSAVAMFGLVAGIGLGLAGLFSLGWYFGGDYAAGRIEKLSEEDW